MYVKIVRGQSCGKLLVNHIKGKFRVIVPSVLPTFYAIAWEYSGRENSKLCQKEIFFSFFVHSQLNGDCVTLIARGALHQTV